MKIGCSSGRLAAALAALLLLSGCGGSPTEIKGKVTLDGQPLEGADLQIMQASSNVAQFPAVSGADGSFKIAILPDAKFEPGTYKVTATKWVGKSGAKLEATPGIDVTQLQAMGQAENKLPAIYATPQQTPIKVELSKDTKLIDVALKSK
jgi:hypothetical protein